MPDEAESTTTELKGVDRAAILLLALGEKDAASLLSHMGPKEVQELGAAMTGLSNVSTDQMEGVMRSFVKT
ncbi:MAG: flagellar motor switch protein FliG, partial [Sedimenticola sp.]